MASTHLGVTVRSEDGRRLLLGSVTLKAHYVDGEEGIFSPDGLYGRPSDKDIDFILPIHDTARIDAICRQFSITRTQETGLSVVVPFLDPEITYERLLLAAVKGYFLPILNRHLTVDILAGEKSARLTADTLEEFVQQNEIGGGIPELISLAKFSLAAAAGTEGRVEIGMPDPKSAARWREDLVSSAQFESLQERFDAGAPVAVRCPVTVRSKVQGDIVSSFDIYLMRDKQCEGRPVFVREGIVISDVRGRRAREVRSIVVIEDKPLATMLGDSENPAHTQWQKDGSNFKGKYIFGPGMIKYVADSVGELMAILSHRNAEADPSLTVDYFSIDPPDDSTDPTEPSSLPKTKPKPGPETPKEKPKIPPRPTRIAIQREPGGFSVKPGSQPPPPPYLLDVRCAYDIRAGNPIRKWSSADFVLGAATPLICTGSAKVIHVRGNAALIRIEGADFGISVHGFDVNRDIYVRAEVREARDADQEA
jgi:hypothetical protein